MACGAFAGPSARMFSRGLPLWASFVPGGGGWWGSPRPAVPRPYPPRAPGHTPWCRPAPCGHALVAEDGDDGTRGDAPRSASRRPDRLARAVQLDRSRPRRSAAPSSPPPPPTPGKLVHQRARERGTPSFVSKKVIRPRGTSASAFGKLGPRSSMSTSGVFLRTLSSLGLLPAVADAVIGDVCGHPAAPDQRPTRAAPRASSSHEVGGGAHRPAARGRRQSRHRATFGLGRRAGQAPAPQSPSESGPPRRSRCARRSAAAGGHATSSALFAAPRRRGQAVRIRTTVLEAQGAAAITRPSATRKSVPARGRRALRVPADQPR